jgi:hypothetical protein
MTITLQQRYERGLEIAHRDALEVVAHGTRKSDGAAVYAVPSRSQGANMWHLVVVEGLRLSCDCHAAKHGQYCAHRAAVRARLELEAQVRRDAREREAERAFHAAARELAEATLTSGSTSSCQHDEQMAWWLHGGSWDSA